MRQPGPAEQQVRRQLESAHALRSEFLAILSHELKNPLNLILMNTELLSRFSSTACKALRRCLACREPFDHFKEL